MKAVVTADSHLNRYYQKMRPEQLEEFKDQPEDSEMKEANVARAENELKRLRNEREEQLETEKQKKNVYSEAPELLNCALIKFE